MQRRNFTSGILNPKITNLHGNNDLSANGSGACSNIRQASKIALLAVCGGIQISHNQPQNKQITDVQDFVYKPVRSVECRQNADHQFSAIYNSYVQCIFLLSGRGLKTIKTSSSSLTLNVHFTASSLPASSRNTWLRAPLNDLNII